MKNICDSNSVDSNNILLKSEGVKDVFKWMDKKCKEQKQRVQAAEKEYKETLKYYIYDDEQCLVESSKIDFEIEKAKLEAFVEVKIGVEKYMRKLRHQGE